MIDTDQIPYVYLTTLGWKSGKQHEIEIWFTTFGDSYYVISENRERSHWVQNIRHHPDIVFRVDEQTHKGTARIVQATDEADLSQHICNLSIEKYGWGDGLVVELTPNQGEAR
jgi:deazaflavin-dependent oxidoreductase (nitroreductase family)